MGRRLLAAGKRLVVCDVDPGAAQAASDDGAEVVATPRVAAAAAETLITMLPSPASTEELPAGTTASSPESLRGASGSR